MHFQKLSMNRLHLIGIFSSLIIAAWIHYIQHGWINNDSVLYFEAARLFSLGEWQAGFQVWGWPLFPALIAGIHYLTNIPIHLAAQILNTILFGIAAASFLQIIREAGGTRNTIIAGILILFSSQYIVGDILPMLLRDQGFWAFFLTSLVFLIRYNKQYKLKDALLWQLCIILATLFRIEGIVYLVALPFCLYWSSPQGRRISSILTAHSVNISLGILGFIILQLTQTSVNKLGRLQEIFSLNLYNELTYQLFSKADIMAENVLGHYLSEFAIEGLLITFIYIMIAKIISGVGVINLFFSITSLRHSELVQKPAKVVLNAVILISLINMFLIITKVFVLSGRYVLPLTFTLLIYSSFGLVYILEWLRKNPLQYHMNYIGSLLISAFLLGGLIVNILPNSPEYNHEQHAIQWLNEHHVNQDQVFFDSARLRYYADAPYISMGGHYVMEAINKNQHIDAKYIVLSFNSKHPELQQLFEKNYPEYKEVARFYGLRNKKGTLIYSRVSRN